MSDYKERMREYLRDPQSGSHEYGKWGALNVEQREYIRRLLDEMDAADHVIKYQEEELERLRIKKETEKGIYYFAHKQIVEELYVSKDKILQYLKDHEEGMSAEDVYELKQMIEGE